jgi:hypothetical protein
MSIKRTFNGATIIKPGAYSKIVVENLTGFPLQPTGIVGIIGEAKGGEPRVLDILSNTQIQDAKARYKSGPIADALELLVNPSNDPRIANGASTIVVYKVNSSTQSALALQSNGAIDMLNLKSKNYGSDENNINILSSEGQIEDSDAVIEGSVQGDFTLAGGETLIIKVNNVDYTYTTSLSGLQTASAIVGDLNNAGNWSPSKPIIAEEYETGFVSVKVDTVAIADSKLEYGYIKVDAASTIDTILGMSGEDRGDKGSRIFTVKKDDLEEVSEELGGLKQINIKYVGAGTIAKLSIKEISGELKLQTAVTGASGEDLDVLLQDAEGQNQLTLKGLVDLLNSSAAYEASVLGSNPSRNANQLDFYEDALINHVGADVYANTYDILDYFNVRSTLVEAEAIDNVFGSVESFVDAKFFAGADDGSAANSDFADGFEAFKEERINHIIPLISEDKGSLSIDSINALADNHAKWGWSTTGKSERNVYCSKKTSKEALKDAARALNSGYSSICGQQVRVLDRLGNLKWLDPWGMACIMAGLDAGSGIGEPITFKFINANDVRVEDGSWNPRKDFVEMIDAGVLFAEPVDSGGFRCVVGNTTYGIDPSFVWNRISVVEAAGYVAYDLRFNLELQFTGTKAKTGTAEAMANFIKARMSVYLGEDIIVGDDLNEGIGYKNLRIQVEGNTAIINISITPVQGIDFILPTIYLADIRQSA